MIHALGSSWQVFGSFQRLVDASLKVVCLDLRVERLGERRIGYQSIQVTNSR